MAPPWGRRQATALKLLLASAQSDLGCYQYRLQACMLLLAEDLHSQYKLVKTNYQGVVCLLGEVPSLCLDQVMDIPPFGCSGLENLLVQHEISSMTPSSLTHTHTHPPGRLATLPSVWITQLEHTTCSCTAYLHGQQLALRSFLAAAHAVQGGPGIQQGSFQRSFPLSYISSRCRGAVGLHASPQGIQLCPLCTQTISSQPGCWKTGWGDATNPQALRSCQRRCLESSPQSTSQTCPCR